MLGSQPADDRSLEEAPAAMAAVGRKPVVTIILPLEPHGHVLRPPLLGRGVGERFHATSMSTIPTRLPAATAMAAPIPLPAPATSTDMAGRTSVAITAVPP